MSLRAQSKTLRILQEQRFERVGGSRTIKVDVRVIAATNKDLEAEIQKGRFREDLFFRLNVIPIRVPSLRERTEDIGELAHEFIRDFCLNANVEPKELTQDALGILQRYDWPGNVRETEEPDRKADDHDARTVDPGQGHPGPLQSDRGYQGRL